MGYFGFAWPAVPICYLYCAIISWRRKDGVWLLLMTPLLLPILLSGCGLARPNWFNPGPTQYQQHRATFHDPYADNEIAPEVIGGRPRGFQKPLPEPVRNQALQNLWWAR